MSILVSKKAHDFVANAVMEDNRIEPNFKLSEYTKGRMCVLFFYPLDFTFVCPSELIALANRIEEFKNRNVELVGISVDSQFTHLAYKGTPIAKGGIGNIQFPLVSDLNKSIARDYGVLHDESVALRGVFIIDRNFVVRHQLVNDLPIGRSVSEILRTIDALTHYEQYGEVCPANWSKGKTAMNPDTEGVINYLNENFKDL